MGGNDGGRYRRGGIQSVFCLNTDWHILTARVVGLYGTLLEHKLTYLLFVSCMIIWYHGIYGSF